MKKENVSRLAFQIKILSFLALGFLFVFTGLFPDKIYWWNIALRFFMVIIGIWYLAFVFLAITKIKNIINKNDVDKINIILWPVLGIILFMFWVEEKLDKVFYTQQKGVSHEI